MRRLMHCPFIYLYHAWAKNEELIFGESFSGAAGSCRGKHCVGLHLFEMADMPVRRYLTNRF